MKELSSARREKVGAFLTNKARPLEQRLYACYFNGGSSQDVLAELARFQNADGGFGHALEADIRLPGSSVIATTIAFQHLREMHAPGDHPLVVNGCRYLRDTYDPVTHNWPIIPPTVDDAPHAPWWVYGGELSQSLSNPRAEIVGYLADYPEHFSDSMRHQITDEVIDHLMTHPDQMEMHDFLCYVRLYETPSLPEAMKSRLFDKLTRIAEQVVTRDPAQWAEYGLQPLAIVHSPASPFAAQFQSDLDANLDFMIDQVTEAGYWNPTWSWGDLWPEAWATAQQDWRGVLTLANLRTLHAFGRVTTPSPQGDGFSGHAPGSVAPEPKC